VASDKEEKAMRHCLMLFATVCFVSAVLTAGAGYAQSDGTIVAWGWNVQGQCNAPSPNAGFVAVAAGEGHSLGLKSDGTIVAWGYNGEGECDVPSPNADFMAVSAGGYHSLGVKSDGTIVAWGQNGNGQCDVPSPNADFVAVAAGEYHSLGFKSDGTIVAWGNNDHGQCDVPSPNADFIAVAGGAWHSLGVKSDGTIVAWGNNEHGQCDVPSPNADFMAVAGGWWHSLGLKSDGTIMAWGNNDYGQCNVPSPNADFAAVAGGGYHSLGLKSIGTIMAWGWNDYGQCNVPSPNADFVAVAGGGFHSLGLRAADWWVPRIYAVRDVPGDQGGFINVAWDAVPGDNRTEHVITRYTVWRAINPTAAELASLGPESFIARISDLSPAVEKGVVRLELAGSLKYYWKLISSLDAYYLEGYSEVVPTLFDSTAVCTEYHYVQIIAHTSDPYTFWVSPPDSARSVDNVAPEEPLRLAGEQSYAPAGLTLTWKPNAEADLGHYAVYRGTSASFVPGPGNLIASPPDTTAFDGGWRWSGGYYYKVSAVDVHGNESGYALLAPEEITGGGTPNAPVAAYLSQNFPNPFNPVTKIEFGLATPAAVSLRIYDAAGRLVRVLANGPLASGRYAKIWDGRDGSGGSVSSGVYFYRLDAGSYSQTRKMVLLK
jgi:hypothetical protein